MKHRLEQEKDLFLLDQDQDREAYQRLLKDFQKPEQLAEMMEQKLAMHAPTHSRSPSNAYNASGQIVSMELPQDDQNMESQKYPRVTKKFRKLKKECQILTKLVEERKLLHTTSMSSTGYSGDDESSMPAIRKKERDYEGMFEFRKEDIHVIIHYLIIELEPRVAVTLTSWDAGIHPLHVHKAHGLYQRHRAVQVAAVEVHKRCEARGEETAGFRLQRALVQQHPGVVAQY